MTQWVGEPGTGRPRGPRALARAWVEVLVRPHRFFASNVAPGDQAPGVTFLATVVLVEEATRHLLVADSYDVLGGRPLLSALFWLLAAVVLVAPAGVHLVAAVQTLVLVPTVPDRAGVSESVQVLCYATAPCVLAGVPDPWLRSGCVVYGAVLYVVGVHVVHGVSVPKAVAVGAIPAALVFGYGFWGFGALAAAAEQGGAAVDTVVAAPETAVAPETVAATLEIVAATLEIVVATLEIVVAAAG